MTESIIGRWMYHYLDGQVTVLRYECSYTLSDIQNMRKDDPHLDVLCDHIQRMLRCQGTLGDAVLALKFGNMVMRKDWRGMFLVAEDGTVRRGTSTGDRLIWNYDNSSDILATDWGVYHEVIPTLRDFTHTYMSRYTKRGMPVLTHSSPLAHPGSFDSNIWLARHQLALLRRCQDLETAGKKTCILNAEAGAGKSYVILALIMCDLKRQTDGINVIVVPQNILTQWHDYVRTFCGPTVFAVSLADYAHVQGLLRQPLATLENLDIILITPSLHDLFAARWPKQFGIKRVVLDEVDSVPWAVHARIDASHTWLVSATLQYIPGPYAISVADADVEDISCRCDPEFIQASWRLPDMIMKQRICDSVYLDVFVDLIPTEHVEKVNAGDYRWLVSSRDRCIEDDKTALSVFAENLAAGVHAHVVQEQFLMRELAKIAQWTATMPSTFDDDPATMTNMALIQHRLISDGIKNKPLLEMKLRETRDQMNAEIARLKTLHDRMADMQICLLCCGSDVTAVTPCCQQRVCAQCLEAWQHTTCRSDCIYCRERLRPASLIVCEPAKPRSLPHTSHPHWRDKMCALLNIFKDYTKHDKCIVFSQHNQQFPSILHALNSAGIVAMHLDAGTVTDIDRSLQQYKTGTVQCILADACMFGSGINLHETSDVVFWHKIHSKNEDQIIGRAHRYPRRTPLRVWYLLYVNEQ